MFARFAVTLVHPPVGVGGEPPPAPPEFLPPVLAPPVFVPPVFAPPVLGGVPLEPPLLDA
jgi:hypothetical protein